MGIQRMWINQPSTSQPLHKLHGTNVLAIREGDGWRIYFLSGAVISQQAPFDTLSDGWTQSRAERYLDNLEHEAYIIKREDVGEEGNKGIAYEHAVNILANAILIRQEQEPTKY